MVFNNEMVMTNKKANNLNSPKYESKFQYNRLLESALPALR